MSTVRVFLCPINTWFAANLIESIRTKATQGHTDDTNVQNSDDRSTNPANTPRYLFSGTIAKGRNSINLNEVNRLVIFRPACR